MYYKRQDRCLCLKHALNAELIWMKHETDYVVRWYWLQATFYTDTTREKPRKEASKKHFYITKCCIVTLKPIYFRSESALEVNTPGLRI